ncbi:MAG: flagellar basal body L-ring protein FlgH, partial [Pseudomonadota bacterium]
MKVRHRLIACSIAVLATACNRLDHIGQPPPFTPSGELVADPIPLRSERVALANRPPVDPRPLARSQLQTQSASLWRSGPESLFGDRRAQGRGDILTVVVEVDEEAEISNVTNRSRQADEDLSVTALFGLEGLIRNGADIDLANAARIGSQSRSQGDGSVERSEEITLRLAATVTDVLPNGHFVIVGNQEIRVNFELRDLRVQGIIRPEDISRSNEITYDKIADARISYGGRGQITDVQQPRYGQQVAD